MPVELQRAQPALLDQHERRAPSASLLVGLWHEHKFSLIRRALEHLVRTTSVGERQTLGHDRMDLALTQQLEQRPEVRPEPIRVAGTSTHGKRAATSAHGKNLMA